jgi:hypothetical protein
MAVASAGSRFCKPARFVVGHDPWTLAGIASVKRDITADQRGVMAFTDVGGCGSGGQWRSARDVSLEACRPVVCRGVVTTAGGRVWRRLPPCRWPSGRGAAGGMADALAGAWGPMRPATGDGQCLPLQGCGTRMRSPPGPSLQRQLGDLLFVVPSVGWSARSRIVGVVPEVLYLDGVLAFGCIDHGSSAQGDSYVVDVSWRAEEHQIAWAQGCSGW